MVAKCCWRKEKTKTADAANSSPGTSSKKKKSSKSEDSDKEHLLSKRSSVDSSFTQSSVNSCHRHSSAYEDECDARLGDHDKDIIRANEEDLIDLTSPPVASDKQQQQHHPWSNGNRLQHSPKVTFFDQSEDDEEGPPFSLVGSLSPPKPRRKHEKKAPVPEKRSKSAPTKIIAKEQQLTSDNNSADQIQTVELCQRASVTSAQNLKSSLSQLSPPGGFGGGEDQSISRKAALEEDYLQLEKVIF